MRYHFFSSITTVLVASVLVMGLIQTLMATQFFREEKETTLGQLVDVIKDGTATGQLSITQDSHRVIIYMARISGAAVFFTNETGDVLFSTGPGAPEIGTAVPTEMMVMVVNTGDYKELGRLQGLYSYNHYTYASMLTGQQGERLGYVFASLNSADMQAYLLDTMSTFVLSSGAVLLVASVLALVLANRTVLPLRSISDAARRFGEGDYSARVPVEGDDELARLAITFNEMANSIEATDVSRRSFMGNIAHELRTPMTTIKGFIDGMLDGTIPVEQRDRYLAIVSDEVGRLARLTKNMLDISRLEAGEYTPNIVEFDMWGPVASVFINAEQRLLDKNVAVEGLAHDQEVRVLADEDFVHQVLFNLVDNAIKFADEGGTISAQVRMEKNMVITGIRNTGAGIPEDSLPYIFDRFYKADKSRGVNARGAGLGLHISKVLVGLMGGRIWAESEENEWSEFLFALPAAPQKKKR